MAESLPVGIHDGITMQTYLLHRGLSASRLHTILTQSPFHAYHAEGGEPSEASEIGTAIHDGLLEGVDRIVTVDADNWMTKAAKEAREKARAEGKIPMLARKVDQIMNAIQAARSFMATSELAEQWAGVSSSEVTMIWNEDKMICKARPDWLSGDRSLMIHVKTTQGSAEPSSWIRNQLTSSGYDIAAAFYQRGIAALEAVPLSVFLVIEQNPPYGCSLVGLDPAMQELADRKVERGIRIWQQCKATNKYPSYSSRIHYAEPKAWMIDEEESHVFDDNLGEQA